LPLTVHGPVDVRTTGGDGDGGGGDGGGGGGDDGGGGDGGDGGDGGGGTQSELQSPCGSSPCGTVSLLSRGHASLDAQLRKPPALQLIWFPLPVQPQRSDTR
jgi:hypothetical protein